MLISGRVYINTPKNDLALPCNVIPYIYNIYIYIYIYAYTMAVKPGASFFSSFMSQAGQKSTAESVENCKTSVEPFSPTFGPKRFGPENMHQLCRVYILLGGGYIYILSKCSWDEAKCL